MIYLSLSPSAIARMTVRERLAAEEYLRLVQHRINFELDEDVVVSVVSREVVGNA